MAQTGNMSPFRRRGRDPRLAEQEELLDCLEQTRTELTRAFARFNAAGDPDLIESYVFEINSLQARHAYLLRQVKELEQGRGA